MAYISSNANRFYTALETSYGQVGEITSGNRDYGSEADGPAEPATAQRKPPPAAGPPAADEFRLGARRDELAASGGKPGYGPYFQAGLGGAQLHFAPARRGPPARLREAGVRSAARAGRGGGGLMRGEIRFVAAIVDASTVQLNAPFTVLPAGGAAIGAAVTYVPATELPSASVFDYWGPTTAVHRLCAGRPSTRWKSGERRLPRVYSAAGAGRAR